MRNRAIATLLVAAVVALSIVGCQSPQEKAANAQAAASRADLKIKEQRLKMIDDYKKCISAAGDDAMKADNCDRILKAIEALK